MKRKIMTIMLAISLVILNINTLVYAADVGPMVYMESTERGNIGAYRTISIYRSDVSFFAGYIDAGKILVVSAIPSAGGKALDYIETIGLNPTPVDFSGGWFPDSAMSYFKIDQSGMYAMVYCPAFSTTPYTAFLGNLEVGRTAETTYP